MSAPNITPIQLNEYNCKQSKYNDVVPKLPMRSMLVVPSGGGTTVFLTNNSLDIYRDCVSIIYIWSPSINVDSTWKPVKYYIRCNIKPSDRDNNCYFDSYDPAELQQVITTQQKVVDYQKEQKHTDSYQILAVIDDFADDTNFTRKSQLLHQLYIRGRHYMISKITSTRVWKQISPIVINNMTHLFIYRLRIYGDLEPIVEGVMVIYDNNTLLQIYHETISEYSFLNSNLTQRDKRKMFMERCDIYLIPS